MPGSKNTVAFWPTSLAQNTSCQKRELSRSKVAGFHMGLFYNSACLAADYRSHLRACPRVFFSAVKARALPMRSCWLGNGTFLEFSICGRALPDAFREPLSQPAGASALSM